MRVLFTVLGIGFVVVLAIVAVFGVTLIYYNYEDDELEPEVVRLLEETPHQIAADENGYFAWIGVVGPDSAPAYEWGRRWFEEALAADKERKGAPLAIESEMPPDSIQAGDSPCEKIDNCLEAVAKQPVVAREFLERARSMLKRCDAALGFKQYQESWRPQWSYYSAFPHNPYFVCSRLQQTRFALALAEMRDDDALDHLEKELAFHVRQIKGSITLLDTVVAISNLQKDYLLLNQYLLSRPDSAKRQIGRLTKLLVPLDTKANSMATAFKTEWLLTARLALDLSNLTSSEDYRDEEIFVGPGGPVSNAIQEKLYLPNATVNELYGFYSPIANLEQLTGESYRKELAAVENNQVTEEDEDIFGLFKLRNPVGHLLAQIARPSLVRYLHILTRT